MVFVMMPEILAGCGDDPEDDLPGLNLALRDSAATVFPPFPARRSAFLSARWQSRH